MTAGLRLEDLDSGGWWAFTAPARLEPDYRAVTGWSGDEVPQGLAAVIGRLAYTAGRPMPPGGVLVEMSLHPQGPLPRDGRYEVRTSYDVLGERKGRTRVLVTASLRRPDGTPVAKTGFVLDWPVQP